MIRKQSTKSELITAISESFPRLMHVTDALWFEHTSLGAGSGGFLYAAVTELDEITSLLHFLHKHGWTACPLGAGTNLVGTDDFEDGVFYLKLSGSFASVQCDEDGICYVGAGAKISSMLKEGICHGFGGAAALCGIPGTIGGALCMNAGANGCSISDYLLDMTLVDLRDGAVSVSSKSSFSWKYRSGGIPAETMILSARFQLHPVIAATERILFETEYERRSRLPKGRSAGSIFQNPSQSNYAGRLLEDAGMKGKREGAFSVSPIHANWIVRDPDPTTEQLLHSGRDCRRLIRQMKEAVYRNSGIIIQPEVKSVSVREQVSMPSSQDSLKVVVLMGGTSSERAISLLSGETVAKALQDAGHRVTTYDIKELAITEEMRNADVVYPVLHGGFGEDGRLQKLLEDAGIPYVGGSSHACHVVMNKFESKKVMDREGIRNPSYVLVDSPDGEIPASLHFPLIVKPNAEGSTFGLSLVRTASEWRNAVTSALNYGECVLAEEYIPGVEATVGIVMGEVYPLVEIRYFGTLYDYDAKYVHSQGETRYFCPPSTIDSSVQKEAAAAALKFAKAVGNTEMIRVDVIVRNTDKAVFMLEGNSYPGFTESSLLPMSIKKAGRSVPEVCSSLVCHAYRKAWDCKKN